jgi:hypothetical protein
MLLSGFIGLFRSQLFVSPGCMCMLGRLIVVAFLVVLVGLCVVISCLCVVFSRFFVMIVFHKFSFLLLSVESTMVPEGRGK